MYQGKYPRRIQSVSVQRDKKTVIVILNNGERHILTAEQLRAAKGYSLIPQPGEEFSQYEEQNKQGQR